MKKRVFIIHGWDGYPEEGWFPWLKKELEQKEFEVFVPAMPNPSEPIIADWVNHLANIVGVPDKDTYFVGHSIGCQAIMRCLEKQPLDTKIGGAVFVAGWFILNDSETEEAKEIGRPWVETPINFQKIISICPNRFVIFSDNDDVIPQENKELLHARLNTEVIIEHNKGHFSGEDGITELPSALDAVLKIANSDISR